MTPIQKDGPDVNDYYCGLDPFSSHVIRNYDLFIGKNYSLKILNILESTDGKTRWCTPPLMQGQCAKISICIELSYSVEVNQFGSAIFKSKSMLEIQS